MTQFYFRGKKRNKPKEKRVMHHSTVSPESLPQAILSFEKSGNEETFGKCQSVQSFEFNTKLKAMLGKAIKVPPNIVATISKLR